MRKSRHARPKRQSYHHGNLRNALIDAASALVDLHGRDALTLREAARRAGVSQTAPYRHFADRDALLAAVAADSFLMLVEDLRAAAAMARRQSQAGRLEAMAAAYLAFAHENPGRFDLMFARSLGSGDAAFEGARAALLDQLGETLGDGRAKAALALMHGLAALAAAGLMPGTVDGVGVLALARPQRARSRAASRAK